MHRDHAQGLDQRGALFASGQTLELPQHRGRAAAGAHPERRMRLLHRPHPPFWMGAGSPEGIRRAGREGYNLLLDQIAPIELTIERVATYRAELEQQGERFDGMRVGVTRALQICRTEE